GISSGASLGAVLAIYFHLAGREVWLLPACAFVGAAVDAVLVVAIAARLGRGRVFTATLLLVGIAVMSLNVALTTFVLSISLASYNVGREVMYWLLGGLEGRTWDHLVLGLTAIGARHAALIPLSFFGGGVFLVIADVVARKLSSETPVGVVTATVGAPLFLALLVYRRRELVGA